ncbi:MAG: hypothetical protein FWB73_01725 [Treponema sp.]|nr:hypothetical protein [Treponema sp.]
MKSKRVCFILFFILMSFNVFSESMQVYLQNFIKADLAGKIELLYSISSNNSLKMQLGNTSPLYEYALQFVWDNYAQISDLHDMDLIIRISLVNIVQENSAGKIDITNLNNIQNILWKLFLEYPVSNTCADIIIALGKIGKGNRSLISSLNNFLTERNTLFRRGETVDYMIISACISAIMELGDSSSYPVLFSVICSGYPEVITMEAYGALEVIPGNLSRFLQNVIEQNPPDEKFLAFKAVMNSGKLTVSERGQLAEAALSQSLISSEENVDLNAMRYASILALSNLRWTRANALAIRHYYRVQADYIQNIIPKERLLEAIMCLGAVGNSDAALALCLQLGLINIRTQNAGVYDQEITLAIVQSLGLIGDNAAFDHLLSVVNLPYTDYIVAAAREAITRLKW